jgi:hypothetical protein
MHKRLNRHYLGDDLFKFIGDSIANGETGTFQNIVDWKNNYLKEIEKNKQDVIQQFQNIFPESIIELSHAEDGATTFFVKIYFQEQNDDSNENFSEIRHGKKMKQAYDLAETLSGFSEDKSGEYEEYLLIVSPKRPSITKQYYPEIWKKLLKKQKEIHDRK